MLIIAISEELPTPEHGHFWPFLAGAIAYTALLLLLERMTKAAY